jgi:glycosyltransferase involved in cell wall biosynthesis
MSVNGVMGDATASPPRLLFFPFDGTKVLPLERAQTAWPEADKADLPYDLTVVMPIFNTGRYILDSIRSVLLSANKLRLQLICINDGSTDGSLQLVSDFLRDHDQSSAVMIDQPNQGVSIARNVAIPFVRGEYLAFLDSDDLADPGGYRTLIAFAREFDCDVVWGRMRSFFDEGLVQLNMDDESIWGWILDGRQGVVLSPRSDPRPFMIEANSCPRVTRTEFLKRHKIYYPDGLIEDLPVHVKLLSRAERLGFVNTPVYHYRVGRPGQQTQDTGRRWFDLISMLRLSIDELRRGGYSSDHGAFLIFLASKLIFWGGKRLPLDIRREYFAECCREFQHVPKDWIEAFFRQWSRDQHHSFIVWCLANAASQGLWRRSANASCPRFTARFLYRVYGIGAMCSFGKHRFKCLPLRNFGLVGLALFLVSVWHSTRFC